MPIESSELDGLIERSGVGKKTAKRLRDANTGGTTNSDSTRPKGHGAPTESVISTPNI